MPHFGGPGFFRVREAATEPITKPTSIDGPPANTTIITVPRPRISSAPLLVKHKMKKTITNPHPGITGARNPIQTALALRVIETVI